MDQKCQEIHEKLVAEREKCTQEGAIQLTQEQISINVLGGQSGYLRGFGNGPKPTPTSRSTRTNSEEVERAALRATMERLQNETAARSQEMGADEEKSSSNATTNGGDDAVGGESDRIRHDDTGRSAYFLVYRTCCQKKERRKGR